MVKVITIMDDVYADLWRLKTAKGMSFSELFRHMLKNKQDEGRSIIKLAGSINSDDIDHRTIYRIKEEHTWNR